MKKYLLFTFLVYFAWLAKSAAQPTASAPTAGNTYYIYNVGHQQYMAADDEGCLTLAEAGMAVTLTRTEDGTHWYLTTPQGGRLSGTTLERTRTDGAGLYQEWQLAEVEDGKYTVALRNNGLNTYSYLQYSAWQNRPVRNVIVPGPSYANAQWIFVSQSDYEQHVVTLDETATDYEVPTVTDATVHLKRKLTPNSWNSFCVPFAISSDELHSQFGENVRVAEFTGCTETTLQFQTVTDVEAGVPYLIRPTRSAPNGYYEFTGVNNFVAEATPVTQGIVTYTPTFVRTTAPAGAYVLSKNEVYHLQLGMDVKGFRGWFVEAAGEAKLKAWTLDGVATGIDLPGTSQPSDFDIYNTSGQRVRTHASDTQGLPKGVYIVNGKKLVKK